jgi:hypothetical protein
MQAVVADRIDDMTALAADFPGWHIWRSRSESARETGWNATRKGRAPRDGGALRMLAEADASALRSALGQQEALTRVGGA